MTKKPAKAKRSPKAAELAQALQHIKEAGQSMHLAAESVAHANATTQTVYGIVADFRLRFECVQQDFQKMAAAYTASEARFREMDARLGQISHYVQATRAPPAFVQVGGAPSGYVIPPALGNGIR